MSFVFLLVGLTLSLFRVVLRIQLPMAGHCGQLCSFSWWWHSPSCCWVPADTTGARESQASPLLVKCSNLARSYWFLIVVIVPTYVPTFQTVALIHPMAKLLGSLMNHSIPCTSSIVRNFVTFNLKNSFFPSGDCPSPCSMYFCSTWLGGGFQTFLMSPLFGEDSHFDSYFSDGLTPPSSWFSVVVSSTVF